MAEDWLPVPFSRVVDDHVRAWQALADAAGEVVQLPARSVRRLLDPDAPGPRDPLAEATAEIGRLMGALAQARGHVGALEARLVELGEAHAAQVEQLRGAYSRLELEVASRAERAVDDQKLVLYQILEPLLTQLPIVRHAVASGRPVEATDLLDLLGPLDEALAKLGFARIGDVGAEVVFDPNRHQAVGGPAPDAGAAVTVKHPGWALEERILRRARVSY